MTIPEHLSLGQLIERLEKEDPAKVVRRGFDSPHSYRGYYEDLAFEPAPDVKVADMLAAARSAVGTTYQGWKGGDYTMKEYTDVWLAVEGCCGESIGAVLLDRLLADEAEPAAKPTVPVRLPIGVTPPVTVNDQAELARVVYLALTSLVDFAATPFASEASARRQTNVIVDVLLSGKTSAQLAIEATNGQEGGDANVSAPDADLPDPAYDRAAREFENHPEVADDLADDEGDGPWRYDVDARHDFYDPMGEDR